MSHELPTIGYVVKRYPRYSETFIVNEILAHERAGATIHIFALRPPNDTHFQDIISKVKAPVHYLPSGKYKNESGWEMMKDTVNEAHAPNTPKLLQQHGAREALQAAALSQQIKQLGITHLHAHFATLPAEVARLAAKLTGITYSLTSHAVDIYHESTNTEDLKRKFSDAAFNVAISDFNKAYMLERLGPVPSPIHRIYNGIDLGLFRRESPLLRKPEILAVGRLVEKKGFTYLIDACKILAEKQLPFRCQIIGTGILEAELRAKISALGLDARIEMPGPLPQNQLRATIKQAAVFAAPCIVAEDGNRDGLPTVLLESMALGTPCIATDVTGIVEVLKHNHTGLLVEQRNADDLADALTRMLQQAYLRETLSASARKMIEKDFDVDVNAARLREHFFRVCQRPATTRVS